MADRFIVHIPHSSFYIPREHRADYLVNEKALRRHQLFLTDAWTNELFHDDSLTKTYIVNPVNRLFCDVERFRDDKDEPNSRIGQGLMYTRGALGVRIRKKSPALREEILRDWYDPHHARLTEATDSALYEHGSCVILDGHSFNSVWPPRLNCLFDRPDICIGTDSFHTPDALRDMLLSACKSEGYHARVNTPYCGSITPIKHYGKDRRVVSVMVEVNRRLYMDEKTGEKSADFEAVRGMCRRLMEIASSYGVR